MNVFGKGIWRETLSIKAHFISFNEFSRKSDRFSYRRLLRALKKVLLIEFFRVLPFGLIYCLFIIQFIK